VIELFKAGGLVMYPLTALSVFALAGIMERLIFWFAIIKQERKTAEKILVIARQDLKLAAVAAEQSLKVPVARFLYAPLALEEPDPELFRLALESTADEELTEMLKGEKLLEAVITIAPLLGLLGTVIGFTTATGLIIAIFASAFHRLFLALQDQQTKLFMKVGNQLELIYRKQCQHRLPK